MRRVLLLLAISGLVLGVLPVAAESPRVIEIEADLALRFIQDGEIVHDIPVVPGETVTFRIDNTAGFDHSFYIGTDDELSIPYGETDVGIPSWTSGVGELEWTVPDDVSGLMFGCTVPGHYPVMQGSISAVEALEDGATAVVDAPERTPTPSQSSSMSHAQGRVEVPWAGMALTLPAGWTADVEEDSQARADLPGLVMWASGDGWCSVYHHDLSAFDRWAAETRADGYLEIGDTTALLFDAIVPGPDWTSYRSTWVLIAEEAAYLVECEGIEPRDDDWLPLIETFEVLPADG